MPSLRDYLRVLRRRKWSIAGITLLTLAVTLFVSFRQAPLYQSTAKLLVKPINNPFQSGAAAVNLVSLDTEQQIASSDEVAILAASKMTDAPSLQDLLDRISVSSPSNTQVLEIGFTDPSPLRAQEGAAAFASAYLEYKTQQAKATVDEARRPLLTRIKSLTGQLRALDDRIAAAGVTTSADQSRREILTSQLAVVRSQLAPLGAILIDPGDVIKAADLPESPASPDYLTYGAAALLFGLALGVGFAFLRERLDDRLRGREDLGALSGSTVLAVIPKVKKWRRRSQAKLVAIEQPEGAVAEAYRSLRTSVSFLAAQRGVKTILITSPSAGEGRTTTAANLAVVLADSGKRVIVVSGDLRKPRLHRFFGVENEAGMVNVLTGTASLSEVLVNPDIGRVRLLPSGPVPAGPSEVVSSGAMGELIKALQVMADFVVIDTPPILSVSDTLTLAPLADGVILVADAGSTKRAAVMHAREQLDQMGVQLLGSVLNDFDPKKDRSYQYFGYAYQYVYASGDEAAAAEAEAASGAPGDLSRPGAAET